MTPHLEPPSEHLRNALQLLVVAAPGYPVGALRAAEARVRRALVLMETPHPDEVPHVDATVALENGE